MQSTSDKVLQHWDLRLLSRELPTPNIMRDPQTVLTCMRSDDISHILILLFGAFNQKYTMTVKYDSGCSAMATPLSELTSIIPDPEDLHRVTTTTATGRMNTLFAYVQVRLLSRDKQKEVIPWHTVPCRGYQNIHRRIYRGNLENNCFVCNHPVKQRLYIIRSKGLLMHRMPQ